jgi:predicted RND superfamily exporter protein
MALSEFDKILQEYKDSNDDFGFSTVSQEEYDAVVQNTKNQTVEDYQKKLKEVEKIIVPFLNKLHSTGDKEYIFWPNRKPIIEEQIKKILQLTR